MALGDEEHPIGFLFEPRIEGDHVRVIVRVGQPGMRALAGELTMRRIEWALLRRVLGADVNVDRRLEVMLNYGRVNAVTAVYPSEQPIEILDAATYEPVLERLAQLGGNDHGPA
jgi:hypothetical protein